MEMRKVDEKWARENLWRVSVERRGDGRLYLSAAPMWFGVPVRNLRLTELSPSEAKFPYAADVGGTLWQGEEFRPALLRWEEEAYRPIYDPETRRATGVEKYWTTRREVVVIGRPVARMCKI